MLTWCERNGVHSIVGIAKNDALLRCIAQPLQWIRELAELSGEKQREFYRFYYAAGSWSKRRKVIAKLEITEQGENPRFIVTNLESDKRRLYDEIYCARGDMEREACPWGRIASRSNSWDCSPIALAHITGGLTSFGCYCRVWLMC